MKISYRKLTVSELDIFIKMRINQLREEGANKKFDLEPALRDYYTRHMTDGTFISWIALDNDCWNKRNINCRKAALFRMSKWKNRAFIKYVYS